MLLSSWRPLMGLKSAVATAKAVVVSAGVDMFFGVGEEGVLDDEDEQW